MSLEAIAEPTEALNPNPQPQLGQQERLENLLSWRFSKKKLVEAI